MAISNALAAMRASARAREAGDAAAARSQLQSTSDWLIEALRAVHGVGWRVIVSHTDRDSNPHQNSGRE